MSQTYEVKLKIEKAIAEQGLDAPEIKGTISLRCGLLLAFVRPDTPDDPVKLEKLRAAARELLKIDV